MIAAQRKTSGPKPMPSWTICGKAARTTRARCAGIADRSAGLNAARRIVTSRREEDALAKRLRFSHANSFLSHRRSPAPVGSLLLRKLMDALVGQAKHACGV